MFLAHVRAVPSATSTSPAPREAVTVRTSLVNPTLGSARDVGMQQRLDAFRDRFSGPYDVGGTKVPAPPMFRMNVPGAPNAKKQGEP